MGAVHQVNGDEQRERHGKTATPLRNREAITAVFRPSQAIPKRKRKTYYVSDISQSQQSSNSPNVSTYRDFRVIFSEGTFSNAHSPLKGFQSLIVSLCPKKSNADIMPRRTHVNMKFSVKSSLTVKNSLEQVQCLATLIPLETKVK
jgi:hypothetical protein